MSLLYNGLNVYARRTVAYDYHVARHSVTLISAENPSKSNL